MTAVLIVGRGRLAAAMSRADNSGRIEAVSARSTTFPADLARASGGRNTLFISARDANADPETNLKIAADIGRHAADVGIPPHRMFHAGSYAAGSARQGAYEMEKRMLETAAITGKLPGCVLRLPIILIPDAKFRAILEPVAWAINAGLVNPALQLPLLQPAKLARKLCSLPDDLGPVEIVRGNPCRLQDLIARLRIIPVEPPDISPRLQMLIDYSNGDSLVTHYESQMAAATL